MDTALSSYLFHPGMIETLIAGTTGMAALAFGGAAAVPKIARALIPAPKATRLGDHIKFRKMASDGRIVICDDGVHAVVISLMGIDLRFNDSGRQAQLNNARQVWIEQMSEMGVRMRIFFVRDRLPKASDYPHPLGVMADVSTTWAKGLPRALSTEFYAVLSIKDAAKGQARLAEAVEQTKSIMIDYRVSELSEDEAADENHEGVYEEPREAHMSPTAFFGRMLSPISRPNGKGVSNLPLAYRLTTDNVRYDSELSMFEFSSGPTRKYAAIFVIEEWSSPMYETTMLDLLAYPIEMTICHDISPISKATAMATLRWQEKMAPGLQPGSDSPEQFSTVAAAIERGSMEEQELCQVQTTITIYGDTPAEVMDGRSMINQLKMVGITPVWPKYTMVPHWFGHFPGFDAQARPQRLLSGEVAILSTFQATPTGQINSDWGKGPIAMFETIDGSPYAFQYHVGDGSPPLGHCVCIGPSGSGKAQPLDAAILTPTGWATMGDMHVGKLVRAPDGSIVPVTGVFPQGELESFEVEFEDGRRTETCAEHLWKVWNPTNNRYEVHKLSDVAKLLAKHNAKGRNVGIPLIDLGAADMPPRDLPLPPYFMGAYLGDGGSTTGSIAMSSAEPEHTLARIESEMPEYSFRHVANGTVDYRMTIKDRAETMPHPINTPTARMLNKQGVEVFNFNDEHHTIKQLVDSFGLYHQLVRTRLNRGWSVDQAVGLTEVEPRVYPTHPVKAALKKLGIHGLLSYEKFVPDNYMNGSAEQRLALLQGLLDTDGSVEDGGIQASFSSTSERLARQVQQLSWSFGAIAKIVQRQTYYTDKNGERRPGRPSWRVYIRAADISPFFSLPRKVEQCRQSNVARRLSIKSIKSMGTKKMQCISIGHIDKLYVTNDFVVTHNTTVMTFLAAMALRQPDLKAYFFDRGRGCEVITKSLGGSYVFFDGDEKTVGLNPMQLDDTRPNRAFLNEWLQLIGDVKSEEYALQEQISDAVMINFDPNLQAVNRNLQQLYGSAFPPDSELRQRLLAWTNPAQFGSLVCAREDTLDVSQRVAGFDFTNVLGDDRLGPAMVSYIMHRILSEAMGQPRLIFIDETEPLLRNENFRLRFKKLLQEGRKERQVIVSCFQRPQAPEEVGVGDTIRGQCPTVFFFRNPQADEKDYADWRLSPRELDFVLGKSYRKKKYAVLVKRYTENGESIILNTSLSALGPLMNIFHSGRPNVLLMQQMQREHGDDFLKHYLAAA